MFRCRVAALAAMCVPILLAEDNRTSLHPTRLLQACPQLGCTWQFRAPSCISSTAEGNVPALASFHLAAVDSRESLPTWLPVTLAVRAITRRLAPEGPEHTREDLCNRVPPHPISQPRSDRARLTDTTRVVIASDSAEVYVASKLPVSNAHADSN